MTRYICTICEYVYDPEVGNPDNDIPPGTAFSPANPLSNPCFSTAAVELLEEMFGD